MKNLAKIFILYQRIVHPNGYRTYYGHLSSLAVTDGTVHAGQVLGTCGNTGWSTGPHLHFEVRNANNVAVDPFNPNLWKLGQWPERPCRRQGKASGGQTTA